MTGFFRGSATFGPGEVNETTLTSPGSFDIFVAKYDASGDLVWAKRAGGTSNDQGRGIAVDGSGNSFVTGSFQDPATFGPGETNETTLTSAGGSDIFVAKYDASGDLVWAKRAGGTSFESGRGIAVDGSGTSYVTGFFDVSATFGPGETNETTLASAGSVDIYVAKYDASGDLVWAKRAGGPDPFGDSGRGIAVDGSGNSYVTGFFYGLATFGPVETNETTLTSAGSADIFVAKYGNQPPVANAGPDRTRIATSPNGAVVTLDGSGSSDPNGDPLTFIWTGPFSTVGGVSPTVTLPGGVHTVTLTVDDGRGGVDTDTVTITVRALKVSPRAFNFTFGKSAAASQPLSVRSVGGPVSYTIPRTASWLVTAPDHGESNGETDTIEVIVDPGTRRPGTYRIFLLIRGLGNILARIPVTMIIGADFVPPAPIPMPAENPAVDVADFIPFGSPGHPMAPKSIIAIFGEGFVAEGEFRAETIPLPTTLGGVGVRFDGIAADLFLVTPGLIHAQLPMGVTGPTATMIITNGLEKAVSEPSEIQIATYSPGIFTLAQNGEGQAIVTFAGTADLAAPLGTVGASRPATAGDLLTVYANGLGPVEPPIENGHNSCEPDGVCLPDGSNVVLRHTTMTPVIRIGGVQVP